MISGTKETEIDRSASCIVVPEFCRMMRSFRLSRLQSVCVCEEEEEVEEEEEEEKSLRPTASRSASSSNSWDAGMMQCSM